MLKVNRRNGFSDRNGIKPISKTIQLIDFDELTRSKLVNSISLLYEVAYKDMTWEHPDRQNFIKYVLTEAYAQTTEINRWYREENLFEIIRETITTDDYDSILTLIEVIAQYIHEFLINKMQHRYGHDFPTVYEYFNGVFKRECMGYRFISNIIVPISDDIEVKAIGSALDIPFASAREHISKANMFLSDRKKPDYENSIKESISAIEAICQEILKTSGKEATLGNMLKRLEDNDIKIHPAMEKAFKSLYGYTSDANGIRHAGDIGGPSSTFEEAKFMLVSCCAFINYLICVSTKSKVVV